MSKLREFWDRAVEKVEALKKERKFKQLQLQGEQDIVNAAKEVSDAEAKLEKEIMNQKDSDNTSFKVICDANEKLAIAKKRYDMAVETFEEFFGVKPKYV